MLKKMDYRKSFILQAARGYDDISTAVKYRDFVLNLWQQDAGGEE